MEPYYQDNLAMIYHGCALDVLSELPDEQIQCVVTSPPYWGLRDYGTAKWEGGDKECNHSVGGQVAMTKDRGTPREFSIISGQRPGVDASRCRKCGATRIDNQIGLEKTPDCENRGKVRIRPDLSKEQLEYVVQRLMDAGLLCVPTYDNQNKE